MLIGHNSQVGVLGIVAVEVGANPVGEGSPNLPRITVARNVRDCLVEATATPTIWCRSPSAPAMRNRNRFLGALIV